METHRAEGEQATGGARTFGSTSVNCPLDAGELEVAAGGSLMAKENRWLCRARRAAARAAGGGPCATSRSRRTRQPARDPQRCAPPRSRPMFATGSATASYQVKDQARCLTALEGDTDRNRFVVGSLDLRGDNEVHVLEFNEDTNEVWCQNVFHHPQEVWHCVSCPAPEHAELLLTTSSTGAEMRAKLFRMEGVADAPPVAEASGPPAVPAPAPLQEVLQLGTGTPLREHLGVIWNAVLPEQVVALTKKRLSLNTLTHGGRASTAAESASCTPPTEGTAFSCGRWDPHHAHSLGLGCGGSLVSLDTRSMKPAHTVEGAHSQRVRSLDYNPNKPYVVLSCGDDYALRYWDMRKPSSALLAVKAHSHWTTVALYNRFHDQLVLSGGTDYLVKLWRAASVSSAPPAVDADEPDLADADGDGLVKSFEDHEQSVFAAAWSAADAWIFASLSLDGKAVINHVPPAEKYKILL